MTGIAPGAYVRAVSGMYLGATGRVVRIDVSASGPYAVVDVGEAHPMAVYVSALELVGAVPTVEQERDAAIAERDRLRAGLEAALDEVRLMASVWDDDDELHVVAVRLDAILRGES